MTGLCIWTRGDRGVRHRAYAAIVLLCLSLLALLAFVQVAHVHSVDTDADHCSLCIALHTAAAPVTAAILAIVLVSLEAVAPLVAVRPFRLLWHRQLFIRPPPHLAAASF